MEKTPNIYLNKPDREDRVKVNDFNENSNILDKDIAQLQAQVATKAPIHSPVFSGTPMAPAVNKPNVIERIITESYVTDALTVEVL